jgi:hypothetical protein
LAVRAILKKNIQILKFSSHPFNGQHDVIFINFKNGTNFC